MSYIARSYYLLATTVSRVRSLTQHKKSLIYSVFRPCKALRTGTALSIAAPRYTRQKTSRTVIHIPRHKVRATKRVNRVNPLPHGINLGLERGVVHIDPVARVTAALLIVTGGDRVLMPIRFEQRYPRHKPHLAKNEDWV